MTGSAEVKAALALARAMRRPAGALMALLDQAERAVSLAQPAPELFAADPARLLAALLDAPAGEAQQGTTARRPRLTVPPRKPLSGRADPPSTGRTAPAVGPAGVVAAARDAPRHAGATAAARAAAPATISPAALGPLRDALRRSIAALSPLDATPGGWADRGIGVTASRTPPRTRDRWRDPAAEIPEAVEGTDPEPTATVGGAFRRSLADTGPASQSARAVDGNDGSGTPEAKPASGRAESLASLAAAAGVSAATAPAHDAMGARDSLTVNTATPDRANAMTPAATRPPELHARQTAFSSNSASVEVPVGATPKSAHTGPGLDDEATALAEASWRHGVDLSWP